MTYTEEGAVYYSSLFRTVCVAPLVVRTKLFLARDQTSDVTASLDPARIQIELPLCANYEQLLSLEQ